MKNNKYRKWILVGGLILALLYIYLLVAKSYFYHEITGTPEAVNGTIDFSDYKSINHNIYLDGQWEFYWKQFIISDQHQLPDASKMNQLSRANEISNENIIMKVPDNWSKYKISGNNLPVSGYGSYRLILKNLSYDKPVTSLICDFGSAYRIYIDGKLTARSGSATKNRNHIFTTPKAELFPVALSGGTTHEVVIEMATTRFSGLYMTPVLSDYHHVINEISIRSAARLLLFGIAIFAFVCLITLYLFSVRQKRYSVWMPVLILFVLIRMMLTTEFYSVWQTTIFFNLSYEQTNEFMYFVTFVLKYLLIFLVQEQCGILLSRREKVGCLFYYSLLYLLYIIISLNIYNHGLSVIIPALTFVMDIYLFFKILKNQEQLNKYGVIVFLGYLFVIIGLVTNSYYINGIIYPNMSLTMMIFFVFFLIIMVLVYTMRMGDLYDDFTISSSRLQMAEKQITMQKEYYEALSRQMNEIREIKHDINHFTGVMLSLSEEGNLEKLRIFLSEYCEKSRMNQLPVFCEHTICNSIIGYYYLRAKENGILLESHCNIAKETVMSDSDFCIVLGNALDNAVYACTQIDSSQPRFVLINSESLKGQRLIKVINSYGGELKIKDGKYITMKDGNSHGFGIHNMRKVVESYGGFIKLEHNDNSFTFMAAIPEEIISL
ncbi:MAG: ATP-binding protein [Lachnospiraceae bacterium]|nr:ATP-binding protein [Lachnospiraceae bacterium]